jgi:hypothetical protein
MAVKASKNKESHIEDVGYKHKLKE